MLLNLLIDKLDAIVQSIAAGSRLQSQFESQEECRHSFGEIFTKGIDHAFQDTVLYRNHTGGFPAAVSEDKPSHAPAGSGGRPVDAAAPRSPAALNVDLSQIDDLQDLSWLDD